MLEDVAPLTVFGTDCGRITNHTGTLSVPHNGPSPIAGPNVHVRLSPVGHYRPRKAGELWKASDGSVRARRAAKRPRFTSQALEPT